MVEGDGLLNRYTALNRIRGSNPLLSAIRYPGIIPPMNVFFLCSFLGIKDTGCWYVVQKRHHHCDCGVAVLCLDGLILIVSYAGRG